MIKLIISLLFSISVLGQTEFTIDIKNIQQEDNAFHNASLIGYQFHEGGFVTKRILNRMYLNLGFFHSNLENFKIIETPILLKYNFGSNFHAFFGSKFVFNLSNDHSAKQNTENTSSTINSLLEFGLQYDVNRNFMMEMKYSLPLNQQQPMNPSYINSNGLFEVGSRLKF